MKLTKENVYINLQGKTKEELTDLWEFLDKNGEINFSDLDNILEELEEFKYYEFYINDWVSSLNIKDKQEITIPQLKQIIKHMENKEFDNLLDYAKSINFKVSDLSEYINKTLSHEYYSELEGDEPEDKAHYFVLKYKKKETLKEKAIRLENELKEVKQQIEEENKPKVGDWVVSNDKLHIYKVTKKV